jgi:hypothetical protein
MLIILAKRGDPAAAWLAERWHSHDAVLVSAADLSMSGWNMHLASPGKSRARIADRDVGISDIHGVIVRVPGVDCEDLPHITPADRQYVASEMTAFLLAWLSGLPCPVLNCPAPGNLGGPCWRAEEWTHIAARLGIPVVPVQRRSPGAAVDWAGVSCEVTVVGEACFGNASATLKNHARKLAKAAGTNLLAVRFAESGQGSAFVSASPWPDLASPEIADAVLQCLPGKPVC